jgi:hypothetical protein
VAARDPPAYPGEVCDLDFYNRIVRPAADALDKLLQKEQNSYSQADVAKIVKDMNAALDEDLKLGPHATEQEKGQRALTVLAVKACKGLGSLHLTCDEERSVCACKTSFPFNNTLQRGQCNPQPGSICAVNHDSELPCAGGLICQGDQGQTTRYCGGIEEFERLRREIEENNSGFRTILSLPIIFAMSVFALLTAS